MCMVSELLLSFPRAVQIFPLLLPHQWQQQPDQLAMPLV